MNARELWPALSVEDDTFHRFEFRFDDRECAGQELDQFGEVLPPAGPAWSRIYVPVGDRARFERLIDPGPGMMDMYVSLVPRREESERTVGLSGVCWAKLETAKQLQALKRFTPAPGLVIREGDSMRRTALWFVSRPHNVVQLERANRRIAHRLGTKKKHGDPGQLFHPPGAVLRWGRKRGVAVHAEFWTGEVVSPVALYGGLPDAPEPWTPELDAA